MNHVIVQNIATPDQWAVEKLLSLGVSTTHEAMGKRGLVDPVLRPIYPGARVAGRAVTVLSHPGDNLMIHAAIEQCETGDILVVTTTSPSVDGMFGDLFATSLQARGVRGLVINAGVRDIHDLREMGFPVWSKAVHAQGTAKRNPGSVNVPVVLPGVNVFPGDVIVADDDGVVVVPRAEATQVAQAASVRNDAELEKKKKFSEGILGLDLYGLRQVLEDLGVRYVESEEAEDGKP
ncbi:4-carboxy-4-hydroxy-2-oxoadipate aldolase/oxaloacetate decarboxylase [Paeniglutamicibacter gangotriensis]|uniref:Putative 4-hydroxy-4-methyl-2-oxoglutarate aldolase n=1 Tax=Paeniglutamicibacter gangotriensis Lz1y TaxID=1276920 RepID=M7N6Q2_9MICC|nr:4-carboxy-4-hydroxy-2-oxoadipate aldolase/oxaloacetate decarboxylase [Paeniglutamicibacter gangotriensis]EMQ97449.1 S-adenosylmethionine:2-demethylmenaquinone methyltransferase [Paeniglutamicibacter gangotriensis Lz1y]